MTEANANDNVSRSFIRGLAYANTAEFTNERGQRQILLDMVWQLGIEG